MVARGDSGEFEQDEQAAVNSGLPPWSDDQTTTLYNSASLDYLQRYTVPSAAWDDRFEPDSESAQRDADASWDSAPVIIEMRDITRRAPLPTPVPASPRGRRRTLPPPILGPAPTPRATHPTLQGVQPLPDNSSARLAPSRTSSLDTDLLAEAVSFRPNLWKTAPVRVIAVGVGLLGAALAANGLFEAPAAKTRGLTTTYASAISPPAQPVEPVAPPVVSASESLPQPVAAAPSAAATKARPDKPGPAAASESSDSALEPDGLSPRELRAQRYKARREAAQARREATRQARLESRQQRREVMVAKHEAAAQARQERHEAALQARQERHAAYLAKREAAKAQRAAATPTTTLARREATQPHATELGRSDSELGLPEPAGSAAGPGTLRVNSRPWSQVFVDDKLIGHTPQLAISLAPGKHKVRLVNSEFGVSKTLDINVRSGESVSRVELLDN